MRQMADQGRMRSLVEKGQRIIIVERKEEFLFLVQSLKFEPQPFRHGGHLIEFRVGHLDFPHRGFRDVESLIGMCQVPSFFALGHRVTVANQLAG